MTNKQTFTLAYSSCPNDTFIFKAIARGLIDLGGYAFDIALEDVETLNQRAAADRYDITKLSFAAFGQLRDRYALLKSGSALGMGCGPLLIHLPGRRMDDKKKPKVAVPGMGTTACHLFRFYMDDCYPGLECQLVPMPFEKIIPAVIEKSCDFGVIIHEGRFVYQDAGLEKMADLGQWWEDTTGLAIPLGCIAIRRRIDPKTASDIEALIRRSIAHAFAHPKAAYEYIEQYAQELEENVIARHIELYVNDFSKDLGADGAAAIEAFLERAEDSGLIQPSNLPLFAC